MGSKFVPKFGSVCSGIEAASIAWHPLGWETEWLAEIMPFQSAVLKHYYPNTANLGDMTKIRDMIKRGEVDAPDILVGGTPCQAFSVAGARNSLDDDRGQLTLEYVRLLDEIDTTRSIRGDSAGICVWENVPGVLNTKDNAFGCFLGALAGEECELQPSGKKWTNAGCVFGPKRTIAWRIMDAQYFGLAQRRKRVFVVASAYQEFSPIEVLFEFDGLRRDSAPSREAREDTSETAICGFAESSFGDFRPTNGDCGTLRKRGGAVCNGSETIVVSNKDAIDYSNRVVGALDTQCGYEKAAFQSVMSGHIVVHGTQDPLIQNDQAFPLGCNHGQENAVYALPGNWIGRKPENGGNAVEPMNNISPCLTKADRHAVAYSFDSLASNSMKSPNPYSGCREVNLSKTLDTTYPDPSKNQGGVCILHEHAYSLQGNMIGRSLTAGPAGPAGSGFGEEVSFTLTKGDRHAVAQMNKNVRRFTPIECERLQGFPDNYTLIPMNKRQKLDDETYQYIRSFYPDISEEDARFMAADGPRYEALGNSMPVKVMEWIGKRINDQLMRIHNEKKASV